MGDNIYVTKAQATAQANAAREAGDTGDAVVRAPGSRPSRLPGSVGGTSTNNPSISKTHTYTTVSSLRGDMGALFANDPAEYKRVVKLMQKAGYGTDGSRASVDWYWNLILTDASSVADRMDPYQYLEWAARKGLGDKDKDKDGPGSGPGYSGPTWQVDLTNKFDARALVDRALNTYLGRDATPKERQQFWKQLNQKQMANPDKATPVGKAGAVGSGGFNAEVFAEDFAKSRDNYAETQASTVLMDWIKESIAGDTTEGLM